MVGLEMIDYVMYILHVCMYVCRYKILENAVGM